MLIPALSFLALVTAVLHIRADYAGALRPTYLFKPLATGLILLIALLAADPLSPFYKWAIVGGLLFALAGDIFLMLPQDRFIPGLVSFLVAHVLYIVAFVGGSGFYAGWLSLLPFVIYAGVVAYRLKPGLGRLRGPVYVYIVVILLMGWQALGHWRQLATTPSLLAFAGALLFMASDTILAFNRFRRPFRAAQLLILTTYYAAQWLIALSVPG